MMTNKKKVTFAESSSPKNSSQSKKPTTRHVPEDLDPERKQRLADLEVKFERRRECEERAHLVVLRLIDNPISEQFLTDAAQFIQSSHYADVTEERAIGQLCGYPLCLKPLPRQPKKKYHISLENTKVYDITDRKNFCSNQCFKASKYFERQLSTIAVWARAGLPPIIFDILPLDKALNKGMVGEEMVADPSAHVRLELEALEKIDRKAGEHNAEKLAAANKAASPKPREHTEEMRIDELAQQVSKELLIGEQENAQEAGGECASTGKPEVPNAQSDINGHCGDNAGVATQHQVTALMRAVDPRSNDPMIPAAPLHPVCRGQSEDHQVEDTIRSKAKREALHRGGSQQSADTQHQVADPDLPDTSQHAPHTAFRASVMDNIRRVNAQQETARKTAARKKKSRKMASVSPLMVIQKHLMEWRTTETIVYLSGDVKIDAMSEFDKKYAALGRCVGDLSGLVDETQLADEPTPQNPIPDIKQLRQDTLQNELIVHEFYKGSFCYPRLDPDAYADTDLMPDVVPDAVPVEDETPMDGERPDRDPVMPFVDAYSQTAIRRKIVFDQMNRALPDILRPLNLTLQDVAADIRTLVNTFSFCATNIVLKPGEWTLAAFFLLRLLALRMPVVKAAFRVPQTEAFFATMTSGLGITEHMIEAVLQDVSSLHRDVTSLSSAVTSEPPA